MTAADPTIRDDVVSGGANALLVPARDGAERHIGLADVLRWPMPGQSDGRARLAIRSVSALGLGQVRGIYGLDHVAPAREPFILALSHSIRREAMIVPALLMLMRGGRHIHFLADWNFMIIPGIGWLMRHGGVVTVMRKSAGVLDMLRPLFRPLASPAERTRALLAEGRAIGVFPEGTISRDPARLLRGRVGTAHLSLETGVPVVPAGIRFPHARRDRPLSEHEPLEVVIGPAMQPPRSGAALSLAAIRSWHGEIMREIARLSGKTWPSRGPGGASADDL